ncbi:uncharacterized protein LOC134553711 isoform X2 [Prinia subflava]|uniref:uncharacterized protein LOC134553711 isoform X2 n=1 Tax=Prinia subflava TaxID=208062 RepID=UPI002FE3D09D
MSKKDKKNPPAAPNTSADISKQGKNGALKCSFHPTGISMVSEALPSLSEAWSFPDTREGPEGGWGHSGTLPRGQEVAGTPPQGLLLVLGDTEEPQPLEFRALDIPGMSRSPRSSGNLSLEPRVPHPAVPPAAILPLLVIPLYSALFLFISLYSSLFLFIPLYFLFIPLYSSLFLFIPLYSTLFRFISLYFSLFRFIPLYSALFLFIQLYFSLFRSLGAAHQNQKRFPEIQPRRAAWAQKKGGQDPLPPPGDTAGVTGAIPGPGRGISRVPAAGRTRVLAGGLARSWQREGHRSWQREGHRSWQREGHRSWQWEGHRSWQGD